jgi:hypothetical protein
MKITQEYVQGVAETMVKQAKLIRASGEELLPVAFALNNEGSFEVVGLGFQNPAEKEILYARLQERLREQKCPALIMVNDAYLRESHGPEQMEEYLRHYTPGVMKHDPLAVEAIVVGVLGPEIQTKACTFKYTKQGNKIVYESEVFDWMETEVQMIKPWW